MSFNLCAHCARAPEVGGDCPLDPPHATDLCVQEFEPCDAAALRLALDYSAARARGRTPEAPLHFQALARLLLTQFPGVDDGQA